MDGSGRLYYSGRPFTGEVIEHLGESLVSLDGYVDGYKKRAVPRVVQGRHSPLGGNTAGGAARR